MEENIKTGNKHVKRRPTGLAPREVEIEATMRFHFSLPRRTNTGDSNDIYFHRGCRVTGGLTPLWGGSFRDGFGILPDSVF